MSLEQLQLIFPKLEELKNLIQELSVVIEELLKSMGRVEKEMEQRVLDEACQKEVEEGIKLEFQEMIRMVQVLRKNPQTTGAILLANDLELLCDCNFSLLQEMQEVLLECSFVQQKCLLAQLKKIRRLLEEQVEIEKGLMVAMPDTLKKQLRELVKKMSQKVHGILSSYNAADSVVCIVERMILLH